MRFTKTQLVSGMLTLSVLLASSMVHSEVIFEEHFDEQPDWTSGLAENDKDPFNQVGLPDRVQRATTHTIPKGWYSIRQDPVWSPSKGYPDKHETIEILASNADKARGGKGKSYVSWRDSYDPGWKHWNSESIMLKYFPQGYNELYVEFWIRFSDDWTRVNPDGATAATSKILRISSWSGDDTEYGAFSDGNIGPIALWDYSVNKYGIRDILSVRGGPYSDNYKLSKSDIPDIGHLIGSGSSGDLNLNFSGLMAGMGPGGTQPIIKDRVNGGFITKGTSGTITHNQIFGPGKSWTKMAFYVKMNSSVGKKDGIFRQWINDNQIFSSDSIPWIRPSETRDENAKWNLVAIGGNDYFQIYPNEQRHEEWYSIDDLVIRTDIPDYVDSGSTAETIAPNPPVDLNVK